jgi:hypothetical protein
VVNLELIYAVTYEFNDENRESELLTAIELDFKTFVSINYDYRDLDFKGVFVKKKTIYKIWLC